LENPDRQKLVMGIINVTPDSFSDGGQFYKTDIAVDYAEKMIKDGVDIIDIGGESTRPGSIEISVDVELERTIPVIKRIRTLSSDVLISIDTTKSIVAKNAINSGANIINDISGLTKDHKMARIASELEVPIVIMHMKGNPSNMQDNPQYDDIISEISLFFNKQIHIAMNAGIKKQRIILDPGIGFGKTIEHNFQLINQLNSFCNLGYPVLIGPSRKSFIGLTLDLPIEDRLEGTAAAVTAGILNGACIVRVHDVKKIKRVVTIADRIRRAT